MKSFSSTYAGILLLVVFSSLQCQAPVEAQNRQNPPQFDAAVAPKIKAVEDLAVAVRQAFTKDTWCGSASVCNSNCGYHDCDGPIGQQPEAECTDRLKPKSCTCSSKSGRQILFDKMNEKQTTEEDCEICQQTEDSTFRLYNYKRPSYRTPANSLTSDGNGASIVIPDTELRRDVCALKTIEDKIRDGHKNNKLVASLYIGTTNGAFMKIPGFPFCRDETSSDPIRTCKDYNPTARPWYITSSTDPRDIVFMFDQKIRADTTLFKSMNLTLSQIDDRDFVAVRTFNEDSVNLVGTQPTVSDGLTEVTEFVRKALVEDFSRLTIGSSGRSDVSAALEHAFDLLVNAKDGGSDTSNCVRYIVLMLGSDDSCFDGCNGDLSECSCVSNLRNIVESRQQDFDTPVSIVVFTTDEKSDMNVFSVANMERVGSSISCPSGIWSRVTANDNEQTGMLAFRRFGALLLFDRNNTRQKVFSTKEYNDAAGLGNVFTMAVPVYERDSESLVAVVGADITRKELQDELPDSSENDIKQQIDLFSDRLRKCSNNPKKINDLTCEANTLRASQDGSAVCAEKPITSDCVASDFVKYHVHLESLTYSDAEEKCKDEGGSLAVIAADKTNIFFTTIADNDGTWIGASGKSTDGKLTWTSDSASQFAGKELDYKQFGDNYDYNEAVSILRSRNIEDICVSVDRRAAFGNWNIAPCTKKLPFVCELKSFDNVSCNSTVSYVKECEREGERRVCGDDDEIGNADPLCKQRGKDLSENDRVCCNVNGTDVPTPSPSPNEPSGPPSPALIGGIVGGVVLLVVLVFVGWRIYVNYFRNQAIQPQQHGARQSVFSFHNDDGDVDSNSASQVI